jgi:hypothetical protein
VTSAGDVPAEVPGRELVIDPGPCARRAGHRELARSADAESSLAGRSCVSAGPADPYRDVGGLYGPVTDTGRVISHRSPAGRVVGCGEEPAGISGDRIFRPAAVP